LGLGLRHGLTIDTRVKNRYFKAAGKISIALVRRRRRRRRRRPRPAGD